MTESQYKRRLQFGEIWKKKEKVQLNPSEGKEFEEKLNQTDQAEPNLSTRGQNVNDENNINIKIINDEDFNVRNIAKYQSVVNALDVKRP